MNLKQEFKRAIILKSNDLTNCSVEVNNQNARGYYELLQTYP